MIKQWRRYRRPNLVFFFVVLSALIVGGLVMVAWGRKSYLGPAEIATDNSKIGDFGLP